MKDKEKPTKNKSPIVVYPKEVNPAIAAQKVVDRKIIISRHFEPSNQMEVSATNHHWLCYLLSDYILRQITRIGDREYTGENKTGRYLAKTRLS